MAVLICIFLTANDTEHVFMCLAAICMSSSWGICSRLCPFFSFFLTICRFLYLLEISPFKISTLLGKKKSLFSNQIGFLLFNFESALYFRYEYFIGYIVYRCFFWGSGLCFHLLFKSLSEREAFNFMKPNLSTIFFMDMAFGINSNNFSPNSRLQRFILCYLSKFHSFTFYNEACDKLSQVLYVSF